jgi:hypothetical protein
LNQQDWPSRSRDTTISSSSLVLSIHHLLIIFLSPILAHHPSGTKPTYSYVNPPKKSSTMAIVDGKLLGEGSVCSVLLKKLHPADRVAHFIPNAIATQRLNDLVAVRQGLAHRAGVRHVKSAIFFTSSPSLGDEEFLCSKHFVKVRTSCPDENVFAPPSPATPRANPVVNLPPVEENVTRTNDLAKHRPFSCSWHSCRQRS